MQASTRAFFRRGGAACAAAAVLIGSSLTAGAASAAPTPEPAPSSMATGIAAPPATDASLPGGLDEALQRDLGMSVEEFNAQGALAATASAVQLQLAQADPGAVVSVSGDTIKVQTSAPAVAQAAAGTAKLAITPSRAALPPNKVDAASVDAVFTDYVNTFGAKDLLSVAVNATGQYLIRTGESKFGTSSATPQSFEPSLAPSIADFAAKYANVVVEGATGPAESKFAAGDPLDLVNGQGYAAMKFGAPGGSICSTGWNGFNKSGAPAIISAGHCTADGKFQVALLTDPLHDTPVTGNPLAPPKPVDILGQMGFSQFGGPGNGTTTANPNDGQAEGNIGTDVSVIDNISANFSQAPKVARWTAAAAWTDSAQVSTDPNNVRVTGVALPMIGAAVCKSGRTTGWTCGRINEIGAYVIAGINYPSEMNPGGDPTDLRAVRGFGSITDTIMSDHGDSGGPVISGTSAVGITSGGGQLLNGKHLAIAADLNTALAATDGYTVKIFLGKPAVTTAGTVYRGGAINGTVAGAPAGTTVTVTIDGASKDVPVGTDGTWSIKAPGVFGKFSIKAQAKNGFSTSETEESSLEVIKETAPAFTSPALNGTSAAPVTAITGTGIAGATVTLAGDVTGSAVVGSDGNWSVAVTPGLPVGSYTVTAKQSRTDWIDSPTSTNAFKVVPAAPAVTSPTNGQQFQANSGPTVFSGTNIAGAAVTLTIDGQQFQATVAGTSWSFTSGQKFAAGNHSVSVVQNVDGVDSLIAASSFTVQAAPAPPVAPAPTPSTPPVAINSLAVTGASSSMLVGGAVGGLLLLGGGAALLFRRRNKENDSE